MSLSARIATASHVGMVRDNNQDRAVVIGDLVAVADGMGGHAGGEMAAELAVGVIGKATTPVTADDLHELVKAANATVHEKAQAPELNGMGTTMVAATLDVDAGNVLLANVGDSRAYLYSVGTFRQLTNDHSLVNDLVREGRITEDEARTHPQRNILTRVLGINTDLAVDQFEIRVYGGDKILLCSDGLTNEVDDGAISSVLARFDDPKDAAETLVEKALEGGGRDNITVGVMFIDGGEGEQLPLLHVEGAELEEPGEPTEALEPVFVSGNDTSEGPAIAEPAEIEVEKPSARFRIRSVVTLLAVLAVMAVAYLATESYAKDAWFADDVDGQVVILQGRPDGFLWVNPSEAEVTDIAVGDLDGASQERLKSQPEWNSLDDARQFVSNLTAAGETGN
jgi:serine/threonine protein phosphatase PrpC